MRAGLRFGIAARVAALAAALALASPSAPALAQAQETPPATGAPAETPPPEPATETIGPRELQNFSINGTVTRPAPQAPAAPPAPAPSASVPGATATQPGPASAGSSASRPTRGPSAAAPSVTVTLPPATPSSGIPEPAPADGVAPQPNLTPIAPPAETPATDGRGSLVPWLLAIALLVGAAVYFFWRQRSQPSYATVGAGHAFVAPEPRPASQPRPAAPPLQRAPAPQPAPEPQLPAGIVSTRLGQPAAATGIVSTRLRPWLEIEFTPARCVVEENKATIQFDVAVFNSGSAPARDVLIEASMFNAGPAQDQEIGAFFANPVAKGDRIPAIAPLKRVALKSAVSLTLDQMRQFEVTGTGKRIFVPLIGFNALYRWSGGDGQTSASYLVGRDTQSEKLAPLRLDLGPRIFRGLGARQHNLGVRS